MRMPAAVCPYCQTYSNLEYRWGLHTFDSNLRDGWLDVAYSCNRCGRVLSTRLDTDNAELRKNSEVGRFLHAHVENVERLEGGIDWQPPRLTTPDYDDVPHSIRSAAQEAHRGFGVGNTRSAILMARSVIEAVAKDHDVGPTRSLFAKIEALKDAQSLPEHFVAMAHAIRTWGNDMAHGDFDNEPDTGDAKNLLELMDNLLDTLYTQKATVKKLQQRRAELDHDTPNPEISSSGGLLSKS